jgi:hypothetical protein
MKHEAENQKDKKSPDPDMPPSQASTIPAIFNVVTNSAWLPFHAHQSAIHGPIP